MLLLTRRTLVRFGPILVVIAAVTLFYGEALGSTLTLHAMHTDDDVVWQFRPDTLEAVYIRPGTRSSTILD